MSFSSVSEIVQDEDLQKQLRQDEMRAIQCYAYGMLTALALLTVLCVL